MSLPSQSSVSAGRSYMYRRRRRRMPRLRVVILGLVLAVGGAWIVLGSDLLGPSGAEASEDQDEAGARTLASDTRSPLIAPTRSPTRAGKLGTLGEAADHALADRNNDRQNGASNPSAGRALPAMEIRQGAVQTKPAVPTRIDGRSAARPEISRASPSGQSDPEFRRLMDKGESELDGGDPLAARQTMNTALHLRAASEGDRREARDVLSVLNERLVFSPTVTPGDPISSVYKMRKDEFLSTVVRKQKLGVDWRAILDVNQISRPERIREGQTLKLIKGPFHAIVSKRAYRVDLYWGPPDKASQWLFIRSFSVGLGENDSTPIGNFHVKNRLANPAWTNPRTGERFGSENPKNPIGEYWIGLEGDGESAVHVSYGLHGTIAPDSVGRQESMGCIRLLPDDIRLLFGLLREGESVVQIRP